MLFCLCLLLPALVLCAAFILIPIVDSVAMSFTSYKLVNLTKNRPGEWNDFANYTRLWKAGKLQSAIGITGWFVFCTVTLTFLISMTLALILNTEPKGARLLRSVMMIPWVIPTVITGLLWAWIYANPYGLVQYLVNLFSGGKITDFGMLNGKGTALWGITIAGLWKQVPLMTLLLLAGMQNVPEDILEAAMIDGAGYFTRLIHILIPYMRSVIAVSVSMCIIENFKQYPLFATLTNGGPVGATTTLAVLSYDEAFVNNNYGSGAAVTTVWLLVMIAVVFLFNAVFRREKQ
jgi:multiple sugar transport system permease protein